MSRKILILYISISTNITHNPEALQSGSLQLPPQSLSLFHSGPVNVGEREHADGEMAGAFPHPRPFPAVFSSLRILSLKRAAVSFPVCTPLAILLHDLSNNLC